ncbi:hypothetical protein [Klebsiella pneumoniae]|uniref:hypothetical protein n=1 Tax=Klebsiella pneumoniae TaxID=573 RepID=UPI000F53919A|nr:hypothetical protein [Klebsiella pneumoniae]
MSLHSSIYSEFVVFIVSVISTDIDTFSGAVASAFFLMASGIILKAVCSSLDGPLVYPVFLNLII